MAMTEINFDRDQCPDMRRFNTENSATKAVQVNIPYWARRVTVITESSNGCRVAFFSDSDDIHSDFVKLTGKGSAEFEWFDGVNTANGISAIYVANKASYSASHPVTVIVEGAK